LRTNHAESTTSFRDEVSAIHRALEFPVTFLENHVEEQTLKALMEKYCQHWNKASPVREKAAITQGQFVEMPAGTTEKDDPSLLTMMLGSMGELLTAVDIVGRRFRDACVLDAATGHFDVDSLERQETGDVFRM
jgi:hypothetical protein